MDNWNIVKNTKYGYLEIEPKPDAEKLKQLYADKYYQDENATYTHSYSQEEIDYFNNKIEQKEKVIIDSIKSKEKLQLLDIGCGEGFTLNYFDKKGWEVAGIDFSDFGLKKVHPNLINTLTTGDIFELIEEKIKNGEKYDVVWLDNVLEHVIDPEALIQSCYELTKEQGMLVIEVPNDFSHFQKELKSKNKVAKEYWLTYPDHLNYFSYASLGNICIENNWKQEVILGDFPIEWYLMNDSSNYANNRAVGKNAHRARMFFENFIHHNSENIDDVNEFYESMAKIGQGRQLIGFFTKKKSIQH